MDIDSIATRMCAGELTEADTKAICKTRGFSMTDAGSPALLKNLLLSDMGLESALNDLNRKEIILLHFLKCLKKPVDIQLFEWLTGKRSNRFSTFNQQYGDVFKHVRTRLVRNWVLMFSSDPSLDYKKTKLEKMVFAFPEQYWAHLPSPFQSPITLTGQGERNEAFVRAKLRQIILPVPSNPESPYEWDLTNGILHMGADEFNVGSFEKWLQRQWALFKTPSLEYAAPSREYVSPMAALRYAFSLPHSDQWIEPEELKPIFEIFCGNEGLSDVQEVFRQGWEKACLVRQKIHGKTVYRRARSFLAMPEKVLYGDFLRSYHAGNIRVDLETIPIKLLEAVSRIALFSIDDGCLIASPDIIRTGRIFNDIQKDPLTAWLAEKSRSFSKTFQTVSQRWGKTLMHRNLLIAKVKNIGLKVTLEKSFKEGTLIFLPRDFVAFPKSALKPIESLVIKSGFAVKNAEQSSGKAENA